MEKVLIYLKKIYIDFLCFLYYNNSSEVHFMNKLLDSTVIMYAITNINKNEIDIDTLLGYIKKISTYLRKQGYIVNNIDKSCVLSFFRMFPQIGNVKEEKIIIKSITERMKSFFFKNLDEKVLNNIRSNNKYILPIIIEDKLINISFISDNELLESLRNSFYYDSIKNKGYLIDLEIVKENCEYKNVIYFLENFLKKENAFKIEKTNYKELDKLFQLAYSIRDNEFKNVEECFGLKNEFNKLSSMYETLFYYLHISNNNKVNLEYNDKVNILSKLTK